MHKGMPPFFTEGMGYQVFRTVRALGYEFSKRALAAGMNPSWGMVLAHLARAEEGLTATDLRQCIGVTAASMSKTLADLEQEGLVLRTPNPEDARSMLVHLGEVGKDRLKVFPTIVAEIEATAFAGFTEAELDQLTALLERIRLNLGDQADRQDPEIVHGEKIDVD